MVRIGPEAVTIGPISRVELERVEVLELLGMTLAHLNDAETRAEGSPRVPLLMAIRDKLAVALREEIIDTQKPTFSRQPPPWTNTEVAKRARLVQRSSS
jgi:hypothetical protein